MMNPFYQSESFIEAFSRSFRERTTETFSPIAASVTSTVFPVAVWPSFLDEDICQNLRTELASMQFKLRSSDLYEFHQTIDLKHVQPATNPLISQLCRELYSVEFLGAMERITGRRLGGHVDISGQRYQRGDFLLCHDDRLERRRIALILYLVDEKDEALKGGRLFALRSDEEGRPCMDNPQTITPHWNTLAFFEVSRFSFHQVEQVFSQNSLRYSITCWFHDQEEQDNDLRVHDPSPLTLLPIKFACALPKESIEELIADMDTLGLPVFRETAHGFFLSSRQYSSSEPSWIRFLLQDSFHKALERLSGWYLDWPTKPVAWCLSSSDHFYLNSPEDSQQDVEYNYKDRTVNAAPIGEKLYLTLFIRFSRRSLSHFFKLHVKPLKINKLPPAYSKLIIVTMRFNRVNQDLRI